MIAIMTKATCDSALFHRICGLLSFAVRLFTRPGTGGFDGVALNLKYSDRSR